MVSMDSIIVHNQYVPLPELNRVVNTQAAHAVNQAMGVRNLGFASRVEANTALQNLKSSIKQNGWPEGTIMHYNKVDVLVPYGTAMPSIKFKMVEQQ